MVYNDTTPFYHYIIKAAIDNMERNKHDYIPIKLYIWVLKFEFHVIFTSQKKF